MTYWCGGGNFCVACVAGAEWVLQYMNVFCSTWEITATREIYATHEKSLQRETFNFFVILNYILKIWNWGENEKWDIMRHFLIFKNNILQTSSIFRKVAEDFFKILRSNHNTWQKSKLLQLGWRQSVHRVTQNSMEYNFFN